MYKKQIRRIKSFILFCLFGVALGSGHFVFGIVVGRLISIISGLICLFVCGFCVMRNIRLIEKYVEMGKDMEELSEKKQFLCQILEKQMRE